MAGDAWGGELGSFCRNEGRRDSWCAGIGFVLQKQGVSGRWVCVNWVRFAQLGCGPGWDWVRFAFLGREGFNPLRVQEAK